MKKTFLLCITITTLLVSCFRIDKAVKESYRYELYIDYKYISYQGQNSTQHIYMEMDSVAGMWMFGKLIIDRRDTVWINGFKKGDIYVTFCSGKNQSEDGPIFISCRGKQGAIRDSIIMRDVDNKIIATETVLYRKPRARCN
ncbi:MAG: hypothetical protein MUC87_11770 [Bacteroidia bacterium]|jgi:hypothetical protein|nr:hypothetical protein [Bacteroidia bacterium]